MEKQAIREEMLKKRLALSDNDYQSLSKVIVKKLDSLLINYSVGLYVPIKNEVDIRSLRASCFPRSENSILQYYCAEWCDLQKGKYGILEPPKTVILKPDIILVPGLAFDKKCNRIGFGRGYFDRTLAHYDGLKIGLAFDFQILEKLPVCSWDIPLDFVITEKQYYKNLDNCSLRKQKRFKGAEF